MIARGNILKAIPVAAAITQRGLLINNAYFGTAAYAYYVDMVPAIKRAKPMVIFDVEDAYVQNFAIPHPRNSQYAIMKMPGKEGDYIPIHVLGFCNLSGFPGYPGPIGFF